MKSSSNFLPLFFLFPLRPNCSTSSVIPKAGYDVSQVGTNSRNQYRTVEVEIIHGGEIGLRLPTDEPHTIRLSAIANLRVMSISVDVVVECQLFVLLDRAVCKDAHANTVTDGPLRNIAVRITTVVSKPTDTTTLGRVNELRKAALSLNTDDSANGAYLVFLQHHEVKVADSFLRV